MKLKRYLTITLLAGLLLALLLGTACQPFLVTRDGETFSGEVETRQFDFTDFSEVEIGDAFDYEITRADSYSISITTYPAAFEQLRVVREGSTLKIERRTIGTVWVLGGVKLKAVITMPHLDSLDGSGATRGTVTNFKSTADLEIDVSGASSLRMEAITAGDVRITASGASRVSGDLTAENTDFDISGASSLQLNGEAGGSVMDASGASRLKLADFSINNAEVTLSGASDATINAAGELDLQLSGASSLDYLGQPTIVDIDLSGGSTIRQR